MKRVVVRSFRAVLLTLALALLCGAPTFAWDVKCTTSPDGPECKDPFERVRTPWRDDPRAEHGTLLRTAITNSGLPPSLLEPFDLTVFAGAQTFAGPDSTTYTSVNPLLFDVVRKATRSVYIQGMANLPDFAYTLADWSSGNETCLPNPGHDPLDCHNYETHIGWLNSNHMLPQSRKWYEHLHSIALEQAATCKTASDALSPDDRTRFDTYLLACEKLALALEGVGHHYLQDSWAIGHMWERWGSTEIADFGGRRSVGLAVSAFTGLLHGAKAMLDKHPLFSGLAPWDDPLSAPHPDAIYSDGGTLHAGVGDQFLQLLLASPGDLYAQQRRALLGCEIDGLRAVYGATAQRHGAMQAASTANFDTTRSVTSSNCWNQRAVNRGIATGMGIHNGAAPNAVRLTALSTLPLMYAISSILPALAGNAELTLNATDQEWFNLTASAAITTAIIAGIDPSTADDTTLATGGMPPLAGVFYNSAYARGNAAAHIPPSAYADPFRPWRVKETNMAVARRSVPLNLTFADATAVDRCSEMTTADLDQLANAVSDARTNGLPAEQVDVRCGRCVQVLAPHLRFGVSGAHDTRREAFCALAAPGSAQFVYTGETAPFTGQEPTDFANLQSAAKVACKCGDPLKVAGGTFRNAASGAIGTSFLVKVRLPDGSLLPTPTTISIQGPAGWNNGAPTPLTYGAGLLRQFYAVAVAPVAGTYTATLTLDGVPATVTFDIATGTVLASPGTVIPNLASPGDIGSSWSAVPGAMSYLTRVFDVPNSKILLPVAFTTATNAVLNGLTLTNSSSKALHVWAFSNDMTVQDPPMPSAFHMSFDRTFITPAVTVAPAAATASPGQVVSLGAAVSGLSDTAVTWSGATPTGQTTAQFSVNNPGTYTVTATSVANSTFRGTSTITVGSSGGCNISQVPGLFYGVWRVVAGVPQEHTCYNGFYPAFLNGGTIEIEPTTPATLRLSNSMLDYTGTFSCANGPRFDDTDVTLQFSLVYQGPQSGNPENINGVIELRDERAPFTIAPCRAGIQAER